jgi:hypothetical protein
MKAKLGITEEQIAKMFEHIIARRPPIKRHNVGISWLEVFTEMKVQRRRTTAVDIKVTSDSGDHTVSVEKAAFERWCHATYEQFSASYPGLEAPTDPDSFLASVLVSSSPKTGKLLQTEPKVQKMLKPQDDTLGTQPPMFSSTMIAGLRQAWAYESLPHRDLWLRFLGAAGFKPLQTQEDGIAAKTGAVASSVETTNVVKAPKQSHVAKEGHVVAREARPKALEEDVLPSGWHKSWSHEHKKLYYWNSATKECTWEKPQAKPMKFGIGDSVHIDGRGGKVKWDGRPDSPAMAVEWTDDKTSSDVIPVSKASLPGTQGVAEYQLGSIVLAKHMNGGWHPAVVDSINENGTYEISWEADHLPPSWKEIDRRKTLLELKAADVELPRPWEEKQKHSESLVNTSIIRGQAQSAFADAGSNCAGGKHITVSFASQQKFAQVQTKQNRDSNEQRFIGQQKALARKASQEQAFARQASLLGKAGASVANVGITYRGPHSHLGFSTHHLTNSLEPSQLKYAKNLPHSWDGTHLDHSKETPQKEDVKLSRLGPAEREKQFSSYFIKQDTQSLKADTCEGTREVRCEHIFWKNHEFRDDNPQRHGKYGRRVFDAQVRENSIGHTVSGIDTKPMDEFWRQQELVHDLLDRSLPPGQAKHFEQYLPTAELPFRKEVPMGF